VQKGIVAGAYFNVSAKFAHVATARGLFLWRTCRKQSTLRTTLRERWCSSSDEQEYSRQDSHSTHSAPPNRNSSTHARRGKGKLQFGAVNVAQDH
jgi:hypothetical protein